MKQPNHFNKGDLVSTLSKPNVLRIGRIRRQVADTCEVEFFTGDVETISGGEIALLSEYLRRRRQQRRFSRSRICRAFFGQDMLRLTLERKQLIQSALRRDGIQFSKEGWDSPDGLIALGLDASFVAGGISKKDADLAEALPRWLEPPQLDSSSRDPLGLQAYAEGLANKMLPGLTVFTSRVGYYGFLCWALEQAASWRDDQYTKREYISRLERALVLCEFVYHGAEFRGCSLLGQKSKQRLLQNGGREQFQAPDRILKNQNSSGALRLYSTSLVSMGFAVDSIEAVETTGFPLALTPLGQRLAKSFSGLVPEGFVKFAQNGYQTKGELKKWGKRLCFCSIAKKRGRSLRNEFLKGFLFEGGDAEVRCNTVRTIMREGLWPPVHEKGWQDKLTTMTELVSEEEDGSAEGLSDAMPEAVLGNDEVLLHFYGMKPTKDGCIMQQTATYELIAVGMSAIFAGLLADLEQRESTTTQALLQNIIESGPEGKQWVTKLKQIPSVAGLWALMTRGGTAYSRAALGGLLIQAAISSRHFEIGKAEFLDPMSCPLGQLLPESLSPASFFASCFPELLDRMITRHLSVSEAKGRQRWCFGDGDAIRRDDLRPMGVGFHSMRYPQVSSLMRDADLNLKEVLNGI